MSKKDVNPAPDVIINNTKKKKKGFWNKNKITA